jgi:hypothetical protein
VTSLWITRIRIEVAQLADQRVFFGCAWCGWVRLTLSDRFFSSEENAPIAAAAKS